MVGSVGAFDSDGDVGSIHFLVSGSSDDRTPRGEIGYRLHYVDGEVPRRLEISADAFLGHPSVYWIDGPTWDQEPFVFRVWATAVDRAGNESAPSNVVIVGHSGDTSWQKAQTEEYARRNAIAYGFPRDAAPDSIPASNDPWKKATRLEEVYRLSTLELIMRMESARIDPAAIMEDGKEIPQGRDLTSDEVSQLQSTLLDPGNFSLASTMCEFIPTHTFTASVSQHKMLISFARNCSLMSIQIDGEHRQGFIFPLVAPVLQAFCEGLLILPPLESK